MASLLGWVGKKIKGAEQTVQRDIVKPVANVVHRDVVSPIANAPSAVDNYANKSAVGRGLQTIGLGALRSGVGTVQGIAGLDDALNHKLGLYQGTSPFSRSLDKLAKNTDITAKENHSNPLLYHGAQTASDLLQFATGGGELKAGVKLAETAPRIGNAISTGVKATNALEKSATKITEGLRNGNVAQRIAGRTAQNILSPKYQATNAAFTALQSGKDISQGKKVTPRDVATNLAVGGVAFPVVGAIGHEAASPVVNAAVKELRKANIVRPSNLNDKEVAHLSNYIDARGTNNMTKEVYDKGVAAANKAGIDHTDTTGIDNLLGAHRTYATHVQQRVQALQGAMDKTLQFAQDHPLGLSSGAVDENGNKLGLNGKPLKGRRQNQTPSLPSGVAPAPVKVAPPPSPLVATGEAAPPIKPPVQALASPAGDMRLPNGQSVATQTPGKQTRFAGKTVPESQYVGEQVSQQTKQNAPTYNPETERGRFAQTLRSADHQGFDSFENDVQNRLQEPHIDSQTATDAIAVAQRLEAKGDDASLRRAADIYDKLSGHLTKSGQEVQAAAILSRRTPQGMKYQALKDIRSGEGVVTPELQRKVGAITDAIAKTKPNSVQRKRLLVQLAKEVDKNSKHSVTSNLVSVWKAGLLSGVKTTQGNIISNSTFGVLQHASTPVSVAVDKGISLFTGKRSLTATSKGLASGTKEGVGHGLHTLKTGEDIRNIGDKYEGRQGINFKNPQVQKVVGNSAQKIFDFMGAQDQPFYYAQLKNSLYDLAKTDGINRGLRGKALSDHMDNLVQNPTEEILQRATSEANKSVLGYDTIGFKIVRGAHNAIDQFGGVSPAGKAAAHAALDILAPFVRVPTAFLARTIDFTPLGFGKEVFSQVANKRFDQRALSKAIGEGATGTGLIALGMALAQNNLLSGNYPKDPKEQQRWKAQGIQPNSVKLGNTWLSLNYLGPVGLLFGAGKMINDTTNQGGGGGEAIGSALAGFGQTLMGQSFLQGFSGFTNAVTDPTQSAKKYVNSQVASLVPSFVNDLGTITDGAQRQADNALQSVEARIPGLRKNLNPKQDVYGNELSQNSTGLNNLSGLKPSDQRHNSVLDEVGRLHDVDPNNSDLQVTPTQVDKKISVEGTDIRLSDKQRYDLQKQVGQATQNLWSNIIKTPEYQAMGDIDKAKALSNSRSDASSLAQREFVTQNNLGTYDKQATASQVALSGGDISKYLSDSNSPSSSSTPAQKYADALKNYNDKQKTMTSVQKYAAEQSLAKLKVQKDYSNDVISLYGLSKDNLSNYFATPENGVDKQAVYKQLQAYDQALYDSGLSSSLKLKYGLSKATGKGSKGGSKSTGKASLSTALSAFRATSSSAKPIKTASRPNITVKTNKLPGNYKQTALKRYAVKKATVSKTA